MRQLRESCLHFCRGNVALQTKQVCNNANNMRAGLTQNGPVNCHLLSSWMSHIILVDDFVVTEKTSRWLMDQIGSHIDHSVLKPFIWEIKNCHAAKSLMIQCFHLIPWYEVGLSCPECQTCGSLLFMEVARSWILWILTGNPDGLGDYSLLWMLRALRAYRKCQQLATALIKKHHTRLAQEALGDSTPLLWPSPWRPFWRVTERVQKVRSSSRSEMVVVSEVQYEVTLGTFQVWCYSAGNVAEERWSAESGSQDSGTRSVYGVARGRECCGSEIEWRKWKWKWKSGSEDIINVWKAKGSVGRRKNPKLQYFSLPHIIQLDSTGLSLIQRAGLLFR